MRTYHIHTFGCQMNVHDSQRMADLLQQAGLTAADAMREADLIVINTCSVREKAESKLYAELGKLRKLKSRKPAPVIVVAGCVARQRGEALLHRMPFIDLVIGPDTLHELPALAKAASQGAAPTVRIELDLDAPTFLHASASAAKGSPSAFVSISKGCDERCSFCIVPYTRGAERDRPPLEIVDEVRQLVQAGAKEVFLLGQTVNGYRDRTGLLTATRGEAASDFPGLLRLIAREVPTLERLRYTSPHPRYFDQALADAHRELPMLCHHVHMPAQSGSDAVLKRMIRRHTREQYLRSVEALRRAQPDMTISTDLIVGFPGETDADFNDTLSLIRAVPFHGVYAFKYSQRPGTPALKLDDDVPEQVKGERLAQVFEVADEMLTTHLNALVGTVQQVLIEEPSVREQGQLTGRSMRNEIVHVPDDGGVRVGDIVQVRIVRAFRHSLEGELLSATTGRVRLPVLLGA